MDTNANAPAEAVAPKATVKRANAVKLVSSNPLVGEAIVAMGLRLRRARIARDIPIAEMARRMGIQANTLRRLEMGAPGVALETLALALWQMNLLSHMGSICAPGADPEGDRLAEMRAPTRARGARALAEGQWPALGRLG